MARPRRTATRSWCAPSSGTRSPTWATRTSTGWHRTHQQRGVPRRSRPGGQAPPRRVGGEPGAEGAHLAPADRAVAAAHRPGARHPGPSRPWLRGLAEITDAVEEAAMLPLTREAPVECLSTLPCVLAELRSGPSFGVATSKDRRTPGRRAWRRESDRSEVAGERTRRHHCDDGGRDVGEGKVA